MPKCKSCKETYFRWFWALDCCSPDSGAIKDDKDEEYFDDGGTIIS